MANIFVVIGKSASGKDTIYRELAQDTSLGLKEVVIYTTRPIREGEVDGVTYHFVSEDTLQELLKEGKVIEHRTYQTVYGPWHYFTVMDQQINLSKDDYIVIGTLESYTQMKAYFGQEVVVPLYIEVENGERLSRALGRERQQEQPKYEEMCRRFLADEQDFSEERIQLAGITQRFENKEIRSCVKAVAGYITEVKKVNAN